MGLDWIGTSQGTLQQTLQHPPHYSLVGLPHTARTGQLQHLYTVCVIPMQDKLRCLLTVSGRLKSILLFRLGAISPGVTSLSRLKSHSSLCDLEAFPFFLGLQLAAVCPARWQLKQVCCASQPQAFFQSASPRLLKVGTCSKLSTNAAT